MSYDYNTLQAACDHRQLLERYQVSKTDLRTLQYVPNPTLNMRAPINGQVLVQVYIHEEIVEQDDPTYGYQILLDNTRLGFNLGTDPFYKIVFNKEVRMVRPLIEVNYLTRQPYCMKCNGLGVLNDYKPSQGGAFIHIIQVDKLTQRCLKFVLTSRCAFYPQFTCPIKDYIGKKFGIQITDADISNAVVNALSNLKNVQIAQNTVQPLDPQEVLSNVQNVTAVQDPTDPTVVRVTATLVVYTNQQLYTTITQPLAFTLQVTG